MSRCQLFEAGFHPGALHLREESCNGTLWDGRLIFHFNNDDQLCGTVLRVQSSKKTTTTTTTQYTEHELPLVDQLCAIVFPILISRAMEAISSMRTPSRVTWTPTKVQSAVRELLI